MSLSQIYTEFFRAVACILLVAVLIGWIIALTPMDADLGTEPASPQPAHAAGGAQ
ncbi:hypothetical protein [Asticcacaulis sp.]|uniref:hypothetical protein n=1 Tax=Asticcacaulis sp. TaxID=1872648 RepID=UPI003F7BDA5A